MAVIDQVALSEFYRGDEEMLADVATMFVQFLPDMESRLRLAVEDGDANSLREVAHQMKSRLGYFCASELQQTAAELENCGRENELDSAGDLLSGLLTGVHQLLSELRGFTRLSLQVCDD